MKRATLVIMAAGVGSRFGGGIKQLEPVGPNDEIIMDYSIYDAIQAGFNKIVFVIRKDLEEEFRKVIGEKIERMVQVEYAFQEIEDIPAKYKQRFRARTKPWGTGQAILSARDVIAEPFLVINADDYYGKEAFVESYKYLTNSRNDKNKISCCMVSFILKNTLSENGGVTRGICHVDQNFLLRDIIETYDILKKGDEVVVKKEGRDVVVDENQMVSMNMWGFWPNIFQVLEEEFECFLNNLPECNLRSEYLLPTIVGNLLHKEVIEVKVLQSSDQWFGVTFKEDKVMVAKEVRDLAERGIYPEKLY